MKLTYEALKERFDKINGNKKYGVVFDSVFKLMAEMAEEIQKSQKKGKRKDSKEDPEDEAKS